MYIPLEAPEICRDPHHRDSRISHGDLPCCECPECLRPIKSEYVDEHRRLHQLEHPYREPAHH